MASALRTPISKLDALTASSVGPSSPRASALVVLAAMAPPESQDARASLLAVLTAAAPPESLQARAAQAQALVAFTRGETNVAARAAQAAMLIAYGTGNPITQRADSWTFVMDGHRFWVLPLGPEGDWAYDTITKQWCQLYTQGFPGLNFTHGVMWGLRVMGGDALYPMLYELDPTQPDDEGWRSVMHVVTGGIQTRSPNMVGLANFRITASAGVLSDASTAVNLTFSDNNGKTWSAAYTINVNQGDVDTPLVWSALGSFSAPGRIFQIQDQGGMLSISGADAALNNYDDDAGSSGGGG